MVGFSYLIGFFVFMDEKLVANNVLSTCEHPKLIVNPYTFEEIIVPCGHCRTCLLTKHGRMSLLCSLEEMQHPWNFFVTLTYAPRYLPRMKYERIENSEGVYYRFIACTRRLKDEYGQEFGVHKFKSDIEFNKLLKKGGTSYSYRGRRYPSTFSYLSYSDLRNFLKRFRKYAHRISSVPVRFFAVGEYGPEHFRCHWHLVFYLDCEAQASQIQELLHKSWRYGRIDFSMSRGKVNRYLSSYVNSISSLPEIFKFRQIRCRSVHSVRFGQGCYEPLYKQIYENGYKFFNEQVINLCGQNTCLPCQKAIRDFLFPRCVCYAKSDSISLFRTYCVYDEFRRRFNEVDEAPHLYFTRILFSKQLQAGLSASQFEFFRFCSSLSGNYDKILLSKDRACQFYYRLFRTSRHFIFFLCQGKMSNAEIMFDKIVKFYHDMDYYNLVKWYQSQEQFFADYPNDPIDDFYSNYWKLYGIDDPWAYIRVHGFLPHKRHSSLYTRKLFSNWIRFDRSVKTKRQNDINCMFVRNSDNIVRINPNYFKNGKFVI